MARTSSHLPELAAVGPTLAFDSLNVWLAAHGRRLPPPHSRPPPSADATSSPHPRRLSAIAAWPRPNGNNAIIRSYGATPYYGVAPATQGFRGGERVAGMRASHGQGFDATHGRRSAVPWNGAGDVHLILRRHFPRHRCKPVLSSDNAVSDAIANLYVSRRASSLQSNTVTLPGIPSARRQPLNRLEVTRPPPINPMLLSAVVRSFSQRVAHLLHEGVDGHERRRRQRRQCEDGFQGLRFRLQSQLPAN